MGMLDYPFGARPNNNEGRVQRELMPFGGNAFMSPFGGFGFPNVDQMMRHSNGGQSFSSMSVTSISTGPDGRPHVYKASNQTATGPGGVRETRKAVSDSRSGVKKLAVGRHLGDRGHVREREENLFTGQREENEEFVNLEEHEADNFHQEWKQKAYAGRHAHSLSVPAITNGGRHSRGQGRNAITYPSNGPDSMPSVTIEELPSSDDEGERNAATPKSTSLMPEGYTSKRSGGRSKKSSSSPSKSKKSKKY